MSEIEFSAKKRLPMSGDTVIARYEGVYDSRIVVFWMDRDEFPHFGLPDEADGRGSQPATHWRLLHKATPERREAK
jgi:hypothetical protein